MADMQTAYSIHSSEWLQAGGCEVYWWEGTDSTTHRLRRVLSVESPVLQAFCCQFIEQQEDRKEELHVNSF